MSEYLFRGKPITGPAAVFLLCAIKRVQNEAPNPTEEDLTSLQEIANDFGKRFEEDLQKEADEQQYDE